MFEHNGIPVKVVGKEKCCGMPKLELGDLETVEKYKNFNIPQLKALIDEGYDIVAPIPSCVLMFKQELPLMFPDGRRRAGGEGAHLRSVRIPDAAPQGRPAAHRLQARSSARSATTCPAICACRTSGSRRAMCCRLVPDTTVEVIERCSGHNGTYAVKKEYRAASVKIGKPVVSKVQAGEGRPLLERLPDGRTPDRKRARAGRRPARRRASPSIRMTLVRKAYGL